MEGLSDASFLGKLLVLTANVRLDWKVITRYKRYSSLIFLIVSNEGKKFKTLTIGGNLKAFYATAIIALS